MRSAIAQLAERRSECPLLFIALGEDAPAERIGAPEVRSVPYQKDPEVVAGFYRAADVYVHSARADTFLTRSLSACVWHAGCGHGCRSHPEQVKSLRLLDCGSSAVQPTAFDLHEATGMLVAPGDPEMMALSIERILDNDTLRRRLGENAAKEAEVRFDLKREINDYLLWYNALLGTDPHHP